MGSPHLLGKTLADALSYQFANTFRYQFVLSEVPRDLPDLTHRAIGKTQLYHCPALPVTHVRDASGHCRGLLLGYAVDGAGVVASDSESYQLPAAFGDVADLQDILAGRYVLLTIDPASGDVTQVSVDPASSLGVVYTPDCRLVASTLLLALDRDIDPNPMFGLPDPVYGCAELAPYLPPKNPELSSGGYCFGQTADRGTLRVLPHHVLSLTDYRTRRRWQPADLAAPLPPAEAAERLVARLTAIMGGFMRRPDGYFAISGGRDSRLLLACAPPAEESGMTLYTYANNFASSLDVKVAAAMAQHKGYPILTSIPPGGLKGSFFPRPKRARRYAQRAALSNGLLSIGDPWWRNGYAKRLSSGALWMRGNFLEIAMARFAPRRRKTGEAVLLHLLSRLGVGFVGDADKARKTEMMDAWRATLDPVTDATLYDVAYKELALGHSQPAFYGLNEQFYLGPAADQTIFDLCMRVDAGERKSSRFYEAALGIADPALVNYPYAKGIMFEARKTQQDAVALIEAKLAACAAA